MSDPARMLDIPETFWKQLKAIYERKGALQEWELEQDQFRVLLPAVLAETNNYKLDRPIAFGGAGLVLRVIDSKLTELQKDKSPVFRALKIPRQIEGRAALLSDSLKDEFTTLASLTHSNIIKLYFADVVSANGVEVPFYLMDYIENPLDPLEYLVKPERTFTDLIKVLQDTAVGIKFLFSKNIAHNDVKPSNILIDGDRAILADLGSALNLSSSTNSLITFTRKYSHPEKLAHATETKDSNRFRRTITQTDRLIVWDLFSFGCTILEMLDAFAKSHSKRITAYQYRYVKLMASRLLDSRHSEDFVGYNFPKTFYQETNYHSIEDILTDIAKLTGEYSLSIAVPELNFHSANNVQTGMYGATPTTPGLLKLLEHPVMRRLFSVSQLGLLMFLYPGATHTRHEHSLGAYSNAGRLIDALWHDPGNPMFRQIMDSKDITACLLAALLHDIGQYPLAHDLEEADKAFFDHEEIGKSFFDRTVDGKPSLQALIDECWKVEDGQPPMSVRVRAILDRPASKRIKDSVLHSIIDGPIDADKLDYLMRDSMKLNVPYGKAIDFDRLLKVITTVHKKDGDTLRMEIGIHENGRISAEAINFIRYSMFGAVYWHRTSRAIKAMLHHATWDMLSGLKLDLATTSSEDILGAQRAAKRSTREKFQQEILDYGFRAMQPSLFSSETEEELERVIWPGVSLGDLQMLQWISKRSSPKAKRLLADLASRQLYKRIGTITPERHRELWKEANGGPSTANGHLELDRKMYEQLLSHLAASLDTYKSATTLINEESLLAIGVIAETAVPILVDIPSDRVAGARNLMYFPENDRWKYSADGYDEISSESSDMWRALSDQFGKSIGRIRIFAHPDVADIFRLVSQEQVENCFWNALEALDN